MGYMKSDVKNRRLKGFTLIEMIIVIFIISILASTGFWGVTGFLRSATIRTHQGAAEIGVTAIQNCLVNWEIDPGLATRTLDGITTDTDRDEFSKFELGCAFRFNIVNGLVVSDIGVVINSVGYVLSIGDPQYDRLKRQIDSNFGSGQAGRYDVYFNGPAARAPGTNENIGYRATRAVFSPEVNGPAVNNDVSNFVRVGAATPLYANHGAHVLDYKQFTDKYGCFPYINELP